jgi:tellurite resistance protein TerC
VTFGLIAGGVLYSLYRTRGQQAETPQLPGPSAAR